MNKITVQELDKLLKSLNVNIKEVLEITSFEEYEDWSSIKDFDDINDPDELMLLDEYYSVMRKLCEASSTISYLKRQVIHESTLHLNSNNYYQSEYHEYHCGNGIEFYYYDKYEEKYKWAISRVEHDGERYYIVRHKDIDLNGLRVRYRR